MKKNIIGAGEGGKGGEEMGDTLEDNGEKKINVDEARNADEKLCGQAEQRGKRKREKGVQCRGT